MKIDGLLPIGSVVLLEESTHRVMVIGYYQQLLDGEDAKIFDYVSCLYPEGFLSAEQNLLFDHGQIAKVYSVGYQDDMQFAFVEKIQEAVASYRESQDIEPGG
jgi:hypothetical protein